MRQTLLRSLGRDWPAMLSPQYPAWRDGKPSANPQTSGSFRTEPPDSPALRAVYTGGTPEVHRMHNGFSGVPPVCIRCTSGVHALGASPARRVCRRFTRDVSPSRFLCVRSIVYQLRYAPPRHVALNGRQADLCRAIYEGLRCSRGQRYRVFPGSCLSTSSARLQLRLDRCDYSEQPDRDGCGADIV